MSTTIQISEETKQELLRIMGDLQSELGSRVSYEDAIQYLLSGTSHRRKARNELMKFRGTLDSRKALEMLRKERLDEIR